MTIERSLRCGPSSAGRIVSRMLPIMVAMALTLFSAGSSQSQTPSFNRDVVVIDPAHGGSDPGARLNDQLSERDVTLAVASRMRSLLIARGFTVVLTRQGGSDTTPSTDQRAELANRQHAVACVVVHASQSGNGVNIGTSTLGSPLAVPPTNAAASGQTGVLPWDRAQEPYISQSRRLASLVGAAVTRSNVPLTQQRAALKPLDNLMCPAISIEVEALHQAGSDTVPVWNEGYQQRIADAVAGALVSWRNQAQPPEYVPVPRANGAGQ